MTKLLAAALVACGIILSACGGGPTGPDQPGPPPVNPTLELSPASMPRPVEFRITARGFTPNGMIEFHRWHPFDQECVDRFGPNEPGCNAGEYPPSVVPFTGRESANGPYIAHWGFSGAAPYGEHRVWAVDLTTGIKSNEVRPVVLR